MKLLCSKKNLERAINIAERFTGKNIHLPILGNVLCTAEKNTLKIIATNLEAGIQIFVSSKILKEGTISVPAKIISMFLQSVQEDSLEIESKDGNLLIKTDSRETKINGTPPDDFPLLPKIKKTSFCSINIGDLKTILVQVLPAVSTSEFKPELGGVYFRTTSQNLQVAATDTFRLAEGTVRLSKKHGGDSFSFIVPSKTAQELGRLLGELPEDEEISIVVGENQIMCETRDMMVVSRLIEGKFPEYMGIIPKGLETTCFIDRNIFINAVRSSSIFASKLQDVTLSFGKKSVEIRAANTEVGTYKTKIPSETTGNEVTMSFNYRYLLDGLQALDEDTIFIGCNTENTPALLRNKTKESFIYVLMPIRLT